MENKSQAIIIASLGKCSSILVDGKLYWSEPITEINFHHKAGEVASIRITSDRLPVMPDEEERLKNNFIKWLDELMKGFLTEEREAPSAPEGANTSQE